VSIFLAALLCQEQKYLNPSTGTPTYRPTDGSKILDLLDFFVTEGISSGYTDIHPSYDLTSDHFPIMCNYQHYNNIT